MLPRGLFCSISQGLRCRKHFKINKAYDVVTLIMLCIIHVPWLVLRGRALREISHVENLTQKLDVHFPEGK